MALAFSNNHIFFYNRDAQWSIRLGCTYFTSPDYLAIHCWVYSTLFHPDTINPKGPHVHHYTNFFQGIVDYDPIGILCTQLLAVINYFNATMPIVVTVFPAYKIGC